MKINKSIYFLFITVIILFLSCKKSSYPCPAYNSSSNASMDSSGNFMGGSRKERDIKTGLIKRKKDKNLYDRKR
ncbi:MAG: hypothetical protein EAZ27_12290 [Cytophagales bacterium]|nr:MAG: hypothetical protein EAZ27_12290 [Cytophagales bacterium]